MSVRVLHGDCLDILPTLEAGSIHACVTDPPYELGFMGKSWDRTGIAFIPEVWRQVLRVMKPGAHLAAFGGSRTFHRMAVAIEDAGFELRDTAMWVYAQGFPKSHDVSKAIDKAAGVKGGRGAPKQDPRWQGNNDAALNGGRVALRDTIGPVCADSDAAFEYAPATPEAATWSGWGTALKPAFEPIIIARKPLDGTVAGNTLKHGCGGLNIDACRIEAGADHAENCTRSNVKGHWGNGGDADVTASHLGRWPANLIHDGSDQIMEAFAAYGESKSSVVASMTQKAREPKSKGTEKERIRENVGFSDSGSAARFFYSAKADADDRAWSKHPTVKPLSLVRWLSRLITPPGGHVLDLFAGSGTTGEAASLEGFDVTLIEREAEYITDIHRRLGRASGADTPLFAETTHA